MLCLLRDSGGAVTRIYSHLQTEELHGVVAHIEAPLKTGWDYTLDSISW